MFCYFVAYDMRPDEGQSEYEEVQKELSSKEEELEVIDINFRLSWWTDISTH